MQVVFLPCALFLCHATPSLVPRTHTATTLFQLSTAPQHAIHSLSLSTLAINRPTPCLHLTTLSPTISPSHISHLNISLHINLLHPDSPPDTQRTHDSPRTVTLAAAQMGRLEVPGPTWHWYSPSSVVVTPLMSRWC